MDTELTCYACGLDLKTQTACVIGEYSFCLKCAETVRSADTIRPGTDLSTLTRCSRCGTSLHNGDCPNCPPAKPQDFREKTREAQLGLDKLLHQIAQQSHFEDRYQVKGELARGGMGVVLRAYDIVLRRDVAIKMMVEDLQASDAALRGQFLKEARVGGRLLHPNLLAVFDLGVNRDSQLYYTMRLVNGTSLQTCLEAVQQGVATRMIEFPLRKMVETFKRACEGVDYAHQNGVIHLDLKPQNILVSGFSEVFVIDWGLARVDNVDDTEELIDIYRREPSGYQTTSATMALGTGAGGGQVVGTPAYMSPEQSVGDIEQFGPPADVYGLGGVLHYILYNTAPNHGITLAERLESSRAAKRTQALREGFIARGRRIQSKEKEAISRLEEICLKSLAVCPSDRHTDAADLVLDLEEWLRDTSTLHFA